MKYKKKINPYSQDEHQTLVDKRIIPNLEKEINFLKTKIETKNEIIKNFIKNDSHRDENFNVQNLNFNESFNFGSLHAYQVTQIYL